MDAPCEHRGRVQVILKKKTKKLAFIIFVEKKKKKFNKEKRFNQSDYNWCHWCKREREYERIRENKFSVISTGRCSIRSNQNDRLSDIVLWSRWYAAVLGFSRTTDSIDGELFPFLRKKTETNFENDIFR